MNLHEIDLSPSLLPLTDFLPDHPGQSDYSASRLVDGFYAKDLSHIGYLDDVPKGRSSDAAHALVSYLDKLQASGRLVDVIAGSGGGFLVTMYQIGDGHRRDLLWFDVPGSQDGWVLSVTEQVEATARGVCEFCQSAGL